MPLSTITTNSIADDAITVPKVTDQILTNRNLIINGAMQVAQRGTSFTPSGVTYCLDRFAHYAPSPPSNAVQQSTDVPSGEGFEYSVRMDTVDLRHAVELPSNGKAGVFYNGQTLTLSFWAKTGSSTKTATINFRFIDGAAFGNVSSAFSSSNNSIVITDSWQRFSIQCTVDTTPTASHYACGFSISGSANILYITGVQLEVGDTATPFEHRSFGDELARCQRYYQKSYPYTDYAGNNLGTGSYGFIPIDLLDDVNINFKQTMRATPTLTIYRKNGTATSSAQRADNGAAYITITVSAVRDNGFEFNPGSSVSRRYRLHYVADAEI
jgi:hypothetical protein